MPDQTLRTWPLTEDIDLTMETASHTPVHHDIAWSLRLVLHLADGEAIAVKAALEPAEAQRLLKRLAKAAGGKRRTG